MKVLRVIDNNLEKFLCAIILSVMTVIIFLQIVFRFVGAPLAWTEELGRYLFIWLIYLSSAMAVKLRAHIKVVFHKKGNFLLDLISNAFFLMFAVAFTYYGWRAVIRLSITYPQTSATLHLPMWIPYFSIVLGCALMAIRLVQDTVELVREYRAPESEIKEVDA